MEIKRLVLGLVRTNCYIVYTEDTKKAVIIDPAADSHRISEEISALGVTPEAVLLTHGHFDHMLAAESLKNGYQIPICVAKDDAELLKHPDLNCSEQFLHMSYAISADEELEDGQNLRFRRSSYSHYNSRTYRRKLLLLCKKRRYFIFRRYFVFAKCRAYRFANRQGGTADNLHPGKIVCTAGTYAGTVRSW